jgi:hypothetical protein
VIWAHIVSDKYHRQGTEYSEHNVLFQNQESVSVRSRLNEVTGWLIGVTLRPCKDGPNQQIAIFQLDVVRPGKCISAAKGRVACVCVMDTSRWGKPLGILQLHGAGRMFKEAGSESTFEPSWHCYSYSSKNICHC